MKLIKLSIIALSLGICEASCNSATPSENPKQDSTAVSAQTAPAANDSRPVPLTEAAAKRLAEDDSEKAAADSAAKAAPVGDKMKPVEKKSKK